MESSINRSGGLGILLAALAVATPARSQILSDTLTASTMTLTGGAFSAAGQGFVVTGGKVGVGRSVPDCALDVVGLLTADNANAAATLSSQPGARFAPSAASTWQYTGESLSLTVPAGPSRRYAMTFRQMAINGNGGTLITGVATSNSSFTGSFLSPYTYLPAGAWTTTGANTVLTLAPGTYNYYVWVYIGATLSGPSIADASGDGRMFSDLFVVPQ